MGKFIFSAVVAGFALAFASSASAAILYRGRLVSSARGETEFDDGASYAMVFRLYRLPQGGEPFYVSESLAVGVARDGSFEALLDDPAIDGAFRENGEGVYVGLSLDGGRELMPRRQILMLPRAARARQANALAVNPQIQTLQAQALKSGVTTVRELSAGLLKARQAQGALSVQGLVGEEALGIDLSQKTLSVFGEVREIVTARQAGAVGETLAAAPADGVAFIYASSTTRTPRPQCPGVVRFCRRGEAIAAPVAGEQLSVRYYSFVTK